MNIETLAAIDVGSNAIRLLISNVDSDAPHTDFKKVIFLRLPIRLGEDAFTKGKIDNEKQEQLLHSMKGFSNIMKACNVSKYRACGTSAMREAANKDEIIEQILQQSDINLEIISGQQEADIIFEAGKLTRLMNRSTSYLYIDVGGGTTEVTLYSKFEKIESNSFQIGAVRILSNAVVNSEFQKFQKWLEDIYKKYAPISIIASGGNIKKIHKILLKKDYEPIMYYEIQSLYNNMTPMSYEERVRNYRLDKYRADIIIPALEIFLLICNICSVKDIYVPKVGIVDGIIHQLYFENKEEII